MLPSLLWVSSKQPAGFLINLYQALMERDRLAALGDYLQCPMGSDCRDRGGMASYASIHLPAAQLRLWLLGAVPLFLSHLPFGPKSLASYSFFVIHVPVTHRWWSRARGCSSLSPLFFFQTLCLDHCFSAIPSQPPCHFLRKAVCRSPDDIKAHGCDGAKRHACILST